MANIIEITENGNRLDFTSTYSPIVCGNSNYFLKFNLSQIWQNCSRKACMFVVDGKKSIVDFEGDTCGVPILPNAPFVFVSLLSGDGENQMVTTSLRIRLEPSVGGGDLSEFNQMASYLSKVLGAVNKIQNGEISVEKAQIAENVSNTNMIINGDFKINQRNFSSIEATTVVVEKYTVDRWKFSGDSSKKGLLSVNASGGVDFVGKSSGVSFCQVLESFDSKSMKGKTVTLSFEISSFNGNSPLKVSIFDDELLSVFGELNILSAGTYYFSANIPENFENNLVVGFCYENFVDETTANIKWVKLEIGETPTAFVSRLYSNELELCKRFYKVINSSEKNSWYRRIAMGYSASTKIARFIFQFNEMRTTPTVTVGQNFTIWGIPNGEKIEYTDAIPSLDSLMVQFKIADSSSTTLPQNAPAMLYTIGSNAQIELDAEIY